MKRWFAFCISLVFVAGCSGAGGGANRFLPSFGNSNFATRDRGSLNDVSDGSGRHLPVTITMRIPKHHRGERTPIHPSTISSSTQSVSFAVNGGKAQVFNATTASSNCTSGASGRTCTFMVGAPAGLDTFVVTTYSGANGGGTPLNRGTARFNIVKGKTNSPHITLGVLVSTTADTGMGSLRYAVGTANTGDTIMFALPAGASVALSTPITISTNVNIAGSGVKQTARPHVNPHGLRSDSTFTGTTISGKNANQVFVINSGVNVTISGVVITAGKASVANQPGGAISNQGNLTLSGDAITDNTSIVTNIVRRPHVDHAPHPRRHSKHPVVPRVKHPHSGKGVHPHVSCTATAQYGGALYNNGTVTISNGTIFDGNSVANTCTAANAGGNGLGNYGLGGAIYNDTYGSLFISGSTFSNNAAAEGGAIYNDTTYGQVSIDKTAFTANEGCTSANGCAPYNCTIGNDCSVYNYGDGSAMYDVSGPGAVITNSTFTSNIAGGNSPGSEGYGGALDLEGSSAILTGDTFTGNLAGGGSSNCSYGYGGAVYEAMGTPGSSSLELDNDKFLNNTASGDEKAYGGAIYSDYNPEHGSNNTFTGNSAVAPGSTCESEPYVYGGAIYANYGISMSNSIFSNTTATAAYEVDGGVIDIEDYSTLTGDTFTGNTATTTSTTDEDGYIYGGAIYGDDPVKISKSTFTSNAAKAIGPYGYYVYGAVLLGYYGISSNGNTFTSNTSMATYPDDGYVYGGVMYLDDNSYSPSLTSSNDSFKSNTITSASSNQPTYEGYGAAIYTDTYSYGINVNGDTFASNSVSAQYCDGGAITLDAYYSSNTISNSTFTSNVCGTNTGEQGWSGAIEADYYSTYDYPLTISGSTFTGNSATAGGGAIGDYSYYGLTVQNSTFTGNKVTAGLAYYGGGALDDSTNYGSDTVTNSTFTGNSVAATNFYVGGGAIYNNIGLSLSGDTFSANAVTGTLDGTGGGALFNYDGGASVVNSTFTGNSAGVDGGAVLEFPNNFDSYYTNATFSKNKAARNGGNIENNDYVYLTNTIVAGGTAGAQGADIDNAGGTIYSEDYNLIQTTPAVNPMVTPNPDHDILGKDPVLLALTDNGGPTFTMADTATSPGRADIPYASSNCGNASPSVSLDQRNYTRGSGGKCDIGAYEYGGTVSAIRVRAQTHRMKRTGKHRVTIRQRAPKPKVHDPHEVHHRSTGGK